ncbi:MAG TPA: carboxypeptidase regulatory-like domain-containing protein [Sumerlaeia bacterium]|nr:carboxypeptidase regulatory-like domain-containing protein [Sumerlaeia bacterium]
MMERETRQVAGEKCDRRRFARASPAVLLFVCVVTRAVAVADAAILSSSSLAADGASRSSESLLVAGRVVDDGGKPVPGADVFLYCSQGEGGLLDRLAGTTGTDAQGVFECQETLARYLDARGNDRFAPTYWLIARQPRHGINAIVWEPGRSPESILIVLTGVATSEVTVRDPQDQPVEGARVFLFGVKTSDEGPGARKTAPVSPVPSLRLYQDIGLSSGLSDEKGQVRLPSPPGEALFWVEREGFVPEIASGKRGEPPRGGVTARGGVILQPSARLSGRVATESGEAVPGAAVWFRFQGEREYSAVVRANPEGEYLFRNVPGAGFRELKAPPTFPASLPNPLPPVLGGPETEKAPQGRVEIRVEDIRRRSPWRTARAFLQMQPGDRITRDFQLQRGVLLAGKVLDAETGLPVAKMNLYIDSFPDFQEVATNAEGEFSACVEPEAEVRIDCAAGNYITENQWMKKTTRLDFRQVLTRDTTDVVLRLKFLPVNELRGRIVDEHGGGVSPATVYLMNAAPKAVSDANGNFVLPVVPRQCDFDLFATSPDNKRAGLVRLKAGTSVAVIPVESTGKFAGRVVNTRGAPAGGLKIQNFLPWVNGGPIFLEEKLDLEVDVHGQFALKNVCPKVAYHAEWLHDEKTNRDFDSGSTNIDLSRLESGGGVEIVTRQFLDSLTGVVVDGHGEPVPEAFIQIVSSDMAPRDALNTENFTNEDGQFAVERLAPGDVTLRVMADHFKQRVVTLPTDAVAHKIALKPVLEGSVYRVRVLDGAGKPAPSVPVTFRYMVHENGRREIVKRENTTGPDGMTEFLFKPASEKSFGSGMIVCDVEGRDVACRSVSLNEDTEVTLDLLKAESRWRGKIVSMQTLQPIAGARVRVRGMRINGGIEGGAAVTFRDEFGFRYETTTNVDGWFELSRFNRKDALSIYCSAPGYARRLFLLDPSRESGEVYPLMPGAKVIGRAVVKGSGRPLAGANLMLKTRGESRNCLTAEDGSFAVDDLKPAEYTVRHSPLVTSEEQDFVTTRTFSFAAAAGKTARVVLELEEGIPVHGSIVDPETNRPPEGRMGVNAYDRSGNFANSAITRDDGSWILFLPPGRFDLRYYAGETRGSLESIQVAPGRTYDNVRIEVKSQKESAERPNRPKTPPGRVRGRPAGPTQPERPRNDGSYSSRG